MLFGRLWLWAWCGAARVRLGEAVEAYEEALRLEPGLTSVQESLATARARLAAEGPEEAEPAEVEEESGGGGDGGASLGGFPGMGGGFPGMGGGFPGGMPDLSALGGLEGLMNNPMVQSMMQNPQMMEMCVAGRGCAQDGVAAVCAPLHVLCGVWGLLLDPRWPGWNCHVMCRRCR